MRYLIFEYLYGGHYLEYIRHILTFAKKNRSNDEIFLGLPQKYEECVNNGYFPKSDKFHYVYLSERELMDIGKKGKLSLLTGSYYRCKKITELVRKFDIDQIILTTSVNYICGITLFIPRKASVVGIEYIIPRRRTEVSLWKKMEDRFKMWLYAHTPQLKRVYLLNDEESAAFYNTKYSTSKFAFLPDPIDCRVAQSSTNHLINEKIILLHAGHFRREKGTLDIIDALNLLSASERQRFKFILCGKSTVPEDNILSIEKIEKLSEKMEVEFYNSYVDESFMHSLYQKCDYVLMPYRNYFQSSGNLGHAASYQKPVVGPSKGLLGLLIRKYNLGYTLKSLDAYGIAETLREILNTPKTDFNFKDYTLRCNPTDFASILMDTD